MPLLPSPRSETASRAIAIENAIATSKMEGGEPSAFCANLLALYGSGDISGIEMRERMLRKARGMGPGASDDLRRKPED